MNQTPIKTNSTSPVNFFSKRKLEVYKAIILLAAVMYLYYCAIYSVYWYLMK